MLLDVETVLALDEYKGVDPETVKRKLLGIENAIRAYTNNDFIVRGARIQAASSDGLFRGVSEYIKAGERVEITQSGNVDSDNHYEANNMNVGLYNVDAVFTDDNYMKLDDELFNADFNDLFLVRYPEAIKEGVLDLLKWEKTGRDKIGISSETISRHSVSYYNFSDAEMLLGYPRALMGFLEPYVKARF